MRKKTTTTLAILLFMAFQTTFSANYNIIISGFSYSPNALAATVGDVVTIAASANHPLVEVDQPTWMANGTTPMVGGWGTKTTSYTFTITVVADIYYTCQNHGSNGMKGMITVSATGISQATAAAYNISLYPNPVTNGDFTVKVEGYNTASGKMMLYSEEGKLIDTYTLTGVETPIKTKLPSGVYFYTVMIGNEAVLRNKFVVAQAK